MWLTERKSALSSNLIGLLFEALKFKHPSNIVILIDNKHNKTIDSYTHEKTTEAYLIERKFQVGMEILMSNVIVVNVTTSHMSWHNQVLQLKLLLMKVHSNLEQAKYMIRYVSIISNINYDINNQHCSYIFIASKLQL